MNYANLRPLTLTRCPNCAEPMQEYGGRVLCASCEWEVLRDGRPFSLPLPRETVERPGMYQSPWQAVCGLFWGFVGLAGIVALVWFYVLLCVTLGAAK